ncbi:MAG: DNA processing protein [Ilumatobacter sp.]|jgi:DNA processing protein
MSAVDEDRSYIAVLAGFSDMTTSRLRSLLSGRTPQEAFALAAGQSRPTPALRTEFERYKTLRERWRAAGRRASPVGMADRCQALGLSVVLPEDPDYPAQLLHDPRRPAVLFVQGDLSVLDARRVGIVGTRNPTRRGTQTAARFGYELAEAGVCVVSGLALGIDGAAHRGALAAGAAAPVAIVANGHDAPYPKRHTALWSEVAVAGAVISEWPPGVPPEPYRFPLRNRILAALSEVVVVVESREKGGSLITAHEAAMRGIDVFAVPGPVDQRASMGTNSLLEVGAAPVSSTDTLLVALGLDGRRSGRRTFDARPLPLGDECVALDLCRTGPQNVESAARSCEWDLARAAMSLARLERNGWLGEAGGWFEVIDEYANLA